MVKKKSVRDAIIEILEAKSNKQATLAQLYLEIPEVLGKKRATATIRGTLNRATEGRKEGSYRICFRRVSTSTYKLI